MWPILYHKGFNHEHRIVTLFWGDTVDMETMCAIHGQENMEAVFTFTSCIKKLNLTDEETIILAALSIFFTGQFNNLHLFISLTTHYIIKIMSCRQIKHLWIVKMLEHSV